MKEKIKKYHETLLEERRIKEELIKKLTLIRRVVSKYRPNNRRAPRTASKAGGIPFGLSTLAKGIFMIPDNAGDNPRSNADKIVEEIKKILN